LAQVVVVQLFVVQQHPETLMKRVLLGWSLVATQAKLVLNSGGCCGAPTSLPVG